MCRPLERADSAPTDGADVGGLNPKLLETLRQQVGAGGLAVGSGNAGDAQLRRGPFVEPVGDAAHQCGKTRNRGGEHAGGQLRRRYVGAGFPQHHACAARRRFRGKLEAMHAAATQCEEQTARAHLAAVESQVLDSGIVRRHRRDAVEQPTEGGAHWMSLACTSVAAGTFCKSSGGTSIKRRAPDITLANTGAATVPPSASTPPSSCTSRLGSSITTTVASFGCEAGTKPANTAMIRSVE